MKKTPLLVAALLAIILAIPGNAQTQNYSHYGSSVIADRPACASANRGCIWHTVSALGVLDTVDGCVKLANDTYAWLPLDVPAGGGGAPTTATYLTQIADPTLTAEQAMGALATGLVKNAATTGVQSIYAGTSCTNQFPRALDASGAATCASVDDADFTPSFSGVGACAANQWASTLANNVAPTCTQPAFANLSGAATDAQVPDTITISLYPLPRISSWGMRPRSPLLHR